MLRADGSTVHVEWGATTEVITGRSLVVVAALSVSARARGVREAAQPAPGNAVLSYRQREIVRLVALGQTGPEIADELQITHNTVRTHLRNAMNRMGARSRAHLVAKALAEGHAVAQGDHATVVWTGHVAVATVRRVTEIGSPYPEATGPQRVCFSFEAGTLREAVDAADLVRHLGVWGVRVRPTCRLAGSCRWRILVTSAPLGATRIAALEEEMQGIARRASGIRFTGWLFVCRRGEPKAGGVGPLVTEEALRVLIVDDSAPFRRAARELLERRGYSVVGEADGAASGLAAVERLRPDAVLLDVRLPDGSGFEVCTLLTREQDAPPVLLVSSDIWADAALVKDCGARALVSKTELAGIDLDSIWG